MRGGKRTATICIEGMGIALAGMWVRQTGQEDIA